MMKVKTKYLLKKFGLRVSILFYFISFPPPSYSLAAQARKLVHEKNYLLEKKLL